MASNSILVPLGWGLTAATVISPVAATGSSPDVVFDDSPHRQINYPVQRDGADASVRMTVVEVRPTQLPYSQFTNAETTQSGSPRQGVPEVDENDYDFGDPEPVRISGDWFRSLSLAQAHDLASDPLETNEGLILA